MQHTTIERFWCVLYYKFYKTVFGSHHHKEVLVFSIHPRPGKVSWAKEQSSKEQW